MLHSLNPFLFFFLSNKLFLTFNYLIYLAAMLNSTVFEYVKRNSPVNHQVESRITFVPPPNDDDFSFEFISEILEDVISYFPLDF